ncbi:MAG TPA: TPM domain-containing protein [Thermoanaerobaculia bacterium]|nr:TPM domain-containing protein [Thermoanaerobaculia bacterium]
MTRAANLILHLSSFILALVLTRGAAALEVPEPPTRWFTDRANLVSGTEGDLLNRKLADFEQATGAQFIIYVFPSLENESMEDFTIRAVERWKVGQKKYDNGIVLFIFVQEKKARVEVGYGLEGTVTDAFSSRVIREILAPRFQQGDYAGGLNAAADALMAQIRKGEPPVEPMQRRGQPGAARGEEPSIVVVIFVLFIVFFIVLPMLSRSRSGCGGCIFPFFFPGGGITFGGGGFSGGGGFGGFSGGGFSGGGGGFGGGGASGGW